MGRKDQKAADLVNAIGVLKKAAENWKEGWGVERIRSVLEQELWKLLNELYELLANEE